MDHLKETPRRATWYDKPTVTYHNMVDSSFIVFYRRALCKRHFSDRAGLDPAVSRRDCQISAKPRPSQPYTPVLSPGLRFGTGIPDNEVLSEKRKHPQDKDPSKRTEDNTQLPTWPMLNPVLSIHDWHKYQLTLMHRSTNNAFSIYRSPHPVRQGRLPDYLMSWPKKMRYKSIVPDRMELKQIRVPSRLGRGRGCAQNMSPAWPRLPARE